MLRYCVFLCVCVLTEVTEERTIAESGIGTRTIVAISLSSLVLIIVLLVSLILIYVKAKKKVVPFSASKNVVQRGVTVVASSNSDIERSYSSKALKEPKQKESEMKVNFKALPLLRSQMLDQPRVQRLQHNSLPPLGQELQKDLLLQRLHQNPQTSPKSWHLHRNLVMNEVKQFKKEALKSKSTGRINSTTFPAQRIHQED